MKKQKATIIKKENTHYKQLYKLKNTKIFDIKENKIYNFNFQIREKKDTFLRDYTVRYFNSVRNLILSFYIYIYIYLKWIFSIQFFIFFSSNFSIRFNLA